MRPAGTPRGDRRTAGSTRPARSAARPTEGLDLALAVPGRLEVRARAAAGSVVAVVGPNGAGKSTLLRAVAGLEPATGHLRLAGEDLLAARCGDRRVGVVFQEQLLFPHLSARENVAFGPRARGTGRRRAADLAQAWLDRLGVGELAERRPGTLSGGQAQRVAIARALVTDPALLLLDEPLRSLDVGVAATLRVELREHLAAFAGTTLLVTHDPLDALTLADEVLVLDGGRVAQTGPPHVVAARPQTAHVARLVGLNVVRAGRQLQAFRPSAVTLSPTRPEGSARHRWRTEVVGLAPHGDVVRVQLHRTAADALERHDEGDLIADVTLGAVAELDLAPGRTMWASVKEVAVESYPDPGTSALPAADPGPDED